MTKLILIMALLIVVISCKNDDDAKPVIDNGQLVSVAEVSETSLFLLSAAAVSIGNNDLLTKLKYSVKTYKLIYKTTYNGTSINASGLVFIPKNINDAAPLISVQHGTTFIKSGAPSETKEFTGTEFFASAGYVAIMPDFIGYGASSDIFHPYYDKEYSARAVIDMITATKEYLSKQKIAINDKLFLAGYSEGGYVTLATAHVLETDPSNTLSVTAVAAGAGGYDLTEMLNGITTTNYYAYPSYLAFVIMSFNNTYNWNKSLTYFFNQPYAETLATYMDGKHDGSFINKKLTTKMDDLFNAEFFARLKTADGELDLKEAMAANSVGGWQTQTPIRLFHGTKDEIIPYDNSEVTLQNFATAGSPNVSLTAIIDGTHGNSFIPMLEEVIPWLEEFQD